MLGALCNELLCEVAAWVPEHARFPLVVVCGAHRIPWKGKSDVCHYVHSIAALKWAHEKGCAWNRWTCAYAAEGGHLEVLQWLHKNGCPWDRWTCSWAAEKGHLEVLQWARKNGCPWDRWACSHAAMGGHLEVLKYARTNDCEWD